MWVFRMIHRDYTRLEKKIKNLSESQEKIKSLKKL